MSPAEIERLIYRAMTEGVMSNVDAQPKDWPMPHFYVLELDPAIVQRHKRSHGIDLEEVKQALLEYDDPRLLYDDGPVLPAKISITVESYIYNDVDPSLVYTKDTVYSIAIEPDARWEVTEAYYDATADGFNLVNLDLVTGGEVSAYDRRHLNDEDLSVLRLFI